MKIHLNSAQRRELDALCKRHKGLLTTAHILAHATKYKDSALHAAFTWSDQVAAHRYRIIQARSLLQAYYTPLQLPNGETLNVRNYHSLRTDRVHGGYRQLTAIMGDRIQRRQLIADVLAELQTIRKKYETLHELSDVWNAIAAMSKTPQPENNE